MLRISFSYNLIRSKGRHAVSPLRDKGVVSVVRPTDFSKECAIIFPPKIKIYKLIVYNFHHSGTMAFDPVVIRLIFHRRKRGENEIRVPPDA